jgi:adenine/guanine phosphoribosyltransferase-like PRPP-binding protein
MLVFNKYFYKNKKSKLYFGDRVAVLDDFIYQTGGSTNAMPEKKKAATRTNTCGALININI